ncbi:unnamed protein product, partial [Polarella glacialis]
EAVLEEEDTVDDSVKGLSLEEAETRAAEKKSEAERKAQEEEEEEHQARLCASKLAVVFVVSPDSYTKSPKVAEMVRRWCEIAGVN